MSTSRTSSTASRAEGQRRRPHGRPRPRRLMRRGTTEPVAASSPAERALARAPPAAPAGRTPATSAARMRPRAQRSVASKRSPRGRAGRRHRVRPGAALVERALAAARAARAADGRPELHHRLVPYRRPALGQQLLRPPGERARRAADAVAALDHAPHVGVDRRLLRVPRERADRRGRVGADARQVLQPRRPALAGHHPRRRLQRQRAAVVAEPAPCRDRLGGRRGGERGGRREARQEALVVRHHPRGLRLLQHHLAHEDRPRVAREAPRQRPPHGLVPVHQRVHRAPPATLIGRKPDVRA